MTSLKDNALIIMVRVPELGKVKTRLAKALGDEKTLEIYKKLLVHTRNTALAVDADRYLYYLPAVQENDGWDAINFFKRIQPEGDLGQKMAAAFLEVFSLGYKKVAIIGSDCPTITPAIITEGFKGLDTKTIAVGPSTDGGYYMLGIASFHPEFFTGKTWSTNTVLAETLATATGLGLSVNNLPTLTDVDEFEDLPQHWR